MAKNLFRFLQQFRSLCGDANNILRVVCARRAARAQVIAVPNIIVGNISHGISSNRIRIIGCAIYPTRIC